MNARKDAETVILERRMEEQVGPAKKNKAHRSRSQSLNVFEDEPPVLLLCEDNLRTIKPIFRILTMKTMTLRTSGC